MSQDLKYFLIGIATFFGILLLLGMFAFSGMFMYHVGTTRTTNEVVTAVEKVGTIVNETKDAVNEAKNSADSAKIAAEKITAKEPVVKIVYVNPPVAPKQDPPQDQSVAIQKAVENGLADVKKSINDLGARMDRLDDGLRRVEKKQLEDGERLGRVEMDVNKLSDPQEIMARMTMNDPEFKKFMEKKDKEKKDCGDLSGNK